MTRRDFVKAGLLWIPTRLLGGTQVIQGPGAKLSVVGGDTLPVTSGLVAWWRANSLTLNDGDAVGTWSDSSASANNLSQSTTSNKPIYKTNILNGKPVVRFDGTNDFMSMGSTLSFTLNFTIIIVANETGSSGEVDLLNKNGGSDQVTFNFANANKSGLRGGFGIALSSTAFSAAVTAFKAITFFATATQFRLWENLTDRTGGSPAGSSSLSFDRVAQTNSGGYWNGDIAEIIAYNRDLATATEYTDLYNNYLKPKYGLP